MGAATWAPAFAGATDSGGVVSAAATPKSPDQRPVTATEFAALMAPLGPFEALPRLAVAVSGGRDSLALALLAAGWCRSAGGEVVGLTVDHRLRPGSGAEARQVGRWLAAAGIAYHILVRRDELAAGSRQAAARAARYALLGDWCRRQGVLHLLVAHQREDQAETLLLRLGRGSGIEGLAAMPAVVERVGLRLLRPLLAVPRRRLEATLRALGQPWLDDPSNLDPAYARTALRRLMPPLAVAGLDAGRLAATAHRLGRARAALEESVADWLAGAAAIRPEGWLELDERALAAAPREIGLAGLARCLVTIGGAPYPPRRQRLERLQGRLLEGGGGTLAGCRIVRRRGRLLICREPAACGPPLALAPGAAGRWDGRFAVARPRQAGDPRPVVVDRLGVAGWTALAAARPDLRDSPVPPPARPVLPALWHGTTLLGVPHLDHWPGFPGTARPSMRFAPDRPLAGPGFTVALIGGHII